MVHILCYVPERRGPVIEMIEEPIEVRQVTIALRADERQIQRVYLAPNGEPLDFTLAEGYVQTTIPAVKGYAMIVFEG